MPRIPRGDTTKSVFHVTSRGVERRIIYASDLDRLYFLKAMRTSFRKHNISLFAYCLMPNHFHLLLGTEDTPLGIPMHELLLKFSLNFNHHQSRVGHLFQARYHAQPCRDLRHLINTVTYVHLNPVRATLAASPDEWRWSSHSEFTSGAGNHLNFTTLVDLTGMTVPELRAAYHERITGRIPAPRDISSILREAAASVGIDAHELASGRKGERYTRAKRTAIAMAENAEIRLSELAPALNCTASALRHLRESVS